MKSGSLIIDVSCDQDMGFSFSKPTTFKNPIFKVDNIDYYGVDHTPSYLWDTATMTISQALSDYLPNIIIGKENKSKNKTLLNATDIKDGIINNKTIISFQNRNEEYPYHFI